MVLALLALFSPLLVAQQCQPDGGGPSAASLRGELAHWAHPLLRQRIFGHLGDVSVDVGFTAALHAALRAAAEVKARRGVKRAPRIELLEYGSGRWAVEAARWQSAQGEQQEGRQPPVRLRATVVAQEAVYAELARATIKRNSNGTTSSAFSVTVLHEDGGSWHSADGTSVDLEALPRHDIVVCDSFGSPLDRMIGQASVLTALHRAGRLAKPFATVPAEVTLYAQPVQSEALRRRDRVPDPMVGLRMGAFDRFVRKTAQQAVAVDLESLDWMVLGEAMQLGGAMSMQDPRTFYSIALSELSLTPKAVVPADALPSEGANVLPQQLQFVASATGRLDAVVVWAKEHLTSTQGLATVDQEDPAAVGAPPQVLTTDPSQHERHSQWGQIVHFYREGEEQMVAKGQPISVSGRLSSDGLLLHIDATNATGSATSEDTDEQTVQPWNAEDYVRMLNDAPRNEVYDRAVTAAVHMARERAVAAAVGAEANPGVAAGSVHVLDIGSGEGLLSLVAARAGADRVTALEINPSIAQVSRAVIKENEQSDVITVVQAHSRSVDMKGVPQPQRPNLLVSEVNETAI